LLNDGVKYVATILDRDSARDLALMRISATGLKSLALGNSDSVKLGQTAIAIGNALGEFKNTVSVGVISGLARNVTAEDGQGNNETIDNVIQTDAAINPGNSGGPLLNLKGEVIGINTAIVSNAQNIGFAIPINKAKQVISSFEKNGRIVMPYLGVYFVSLDTGAKIAKNGEEEAIVKNSPADRSGLKEGDVIVSVDNKKLSKDRILSSVIGEHQVGDTLTLEVKRGDETLTIKVVLGEKPEE
jgi:S1-C subfamily serine protease